METAVSELHVNGWDLDRGRGGHARKARARAKAHKDQQRQVVVRKNVDRDEGP